MVKVSEKQYTPLHDALTTAKAILKLDMDVDMYVESNPSLNACSFKLPNQTPEIIINSGLVELLELLKDGNKNLALVVLLHELGHLMFRQSDIDTGMRIHSAFLNDGSITTSVLLQQTANVYRKYCVAMEMTADRVMYSAMKEIEGGWDAIMTVFGKLAGGIRGFPIDCEELLKQYKASDSNVGKSLYTGVTSKDAHPPILFRLQELSDFHLGLVYDVQIVGLQDLSFAAAAKANTLWDSD
jgi:Zn-dependent protease with chaperone function